MESRHQIGLGPPMAERIKGEEFCREPAIVGVEAVVPPYGSPIAHGKARSRKTRGQLKLSAHLRRRMYPEGAAERKAGRRRKRERAGEINAARGRHARTRSEERRVGKECRSR